MSETIDRSILDQIPPTPVDEVRAAQLKFMDQFLEHQRNPGAPNPFDALKKKEKTGEERNEQVGEVPEATPQVSTAPEEALADVKVPETLFIDRKVLLRPDKCPCTLCRWFLWEVGQAVERIGITTLESQADMLRDGCPLLALAMSKDHRAAILWDIGCQQYMAGEHKYLHAAKALCWAMSACEGGVGGYFRMLDMKMFTDIYSHEKVKNTPWGKLLRAFARTKVANFYGMKRHFDHSATLMQESYDEFEALLPLFDVNRDRSVIRYQMCKLTHGISNFQQNRSAADLFGKACKLYDATVEDDWSFLPIHKWMAEDCRARVKWNEAEALYRICSFLVEADNQYSPDYYYSLAYSTVKRLQGGGGKTWGGAVLEAQKPITPNKSVLEYLKQIMEVGMNAEKISMKIYGAYDKLVKAENLPFNPKEETLEFLKSHDVHPVVPKPSWNDPFEPEKDEKGNYIYDVDDINLQVPSTTFCSNCFSDQNLKKCKGCEQVRYCGTECQKAHWSQGHHKKHCATLGKAAKFPKISL